MKRLTFRWEAIGENFCSGTVIIDEWDDGEKTTDPPVRRTEIPVRVEKNITSLANVPPHIDQQTRNEISATMRIFFSGVQKETSVYRWLGVSTD